MTLIKRNASKTNAKTNHGYVYTAPNCRRCGSNCSCSEEEIDAGGPA